MGDGEATLIIPQRCLVFLSVNMLRVAIKLLMLSVCGAILWRWEQSLGDYQVK